VFFAGSEVQVVTVDCTILFGAGPTTKQTTSAVNYKNTINITHVDTTQELPNSTNYEITTTAPLGTGGSFILFRANLAGESTAKRHTTYCRILYIMHGRLQKHHQELQPQ
jgi:hypothetical protein